MKKKSRPKPTHEEIARCACLIYESRSREHGRDLEDWLEAEAQLIADRNQEVKTEHRKRSNERTVPWENVQPAEIITTNHSK